MTNEKKEAKKKTDEQILFPETTVIADGVSYVIKPWTLGEILEINPILENIFNALESKGTKIDLENLNMNMIKDIYFAAMPQVVELIESLISLAYPQTD